MTKHLLIAVAFGMLVACTPSKTESKTTSSSTSKRTTTSVKRVVVSKPVVAKRVVSTPTKTYTSYSTPVKRKSSSYIEYDYYDLRDCSVVNRGFKTMYKCIDRD